MPPRLIVILVALVGVLAAGPALAQADQAAAISPCPRPAPHSAAREPANLFSKGGALDVSLDFQSAKDRFGRTLYCYITPAGQEAPTLHVKPGDYLNITLTNRDKSAAMASRAAPEMAMRASSEICAGQMSMLSVNIHFHGTNTSPTCHQDEVIHTIVNPGQTFQYHLLIPADEPPGLYFYHPHVHMADGPQVLGGASGAIEVEGIENVQPAVAGLPERFLIIRDMVVPGNPKAVGSVPSKDLSLNYVPIEWPANTPAVIPTQPARKEFWRVVNAAADTPQDIEVLYDGVLQPLRVVAIDGVPTFSQDPARRGRPLTVLHFLMAAASRVEFILTTPSSGVKEAILRTARIDTGPAGDNDPQRTLAVITTPATSADAQEARVPMPFTVTGRVGDRFAAAGGETITAHRVLYFSEEPQMKATRFFITVVGQKPTPFVPDEAPRIVTRQGAVELWTIENRTLEVHDFHIHQLHFLLQERDGKPVPAAERQFYDTIQVPFWSGHGPFPSVTVLMDFRGPIVGDFVYHCHILQHQDQGMMAKIRVLPAKSG